MTSSDLSTTLQSHVPNATLHWSTFREQLRLDVGQGDLFAVLRCLQQQTGFDLLIDITAVDYLEYENATDRFEIIYILVSTEANQRLIVRTKLNEPDLELPSVFSLWSGADWLEREVYDMFGIRFSGRGDVRRILMPEEFTAFPLRKDYPVKGRGERHNFPVITRAES